MTSFGANEIRHGNYMPTFKVQGQIYHRAGSLLPPVDGNHQFVQIYFIGDPQEEVERRCQIHDGLNRVIVRDLQDFFHAENQLIKNFKTALERMPTDEYTVVIRADKVPAGGHQRQYNAPTAEEVAVVIAGEECESRHIVLHRRNDGLKRIPETHRSYDALQYPILFWEGQDGYHFNIKMRNPQTGQETEKKVSSMNLYAYRLMIRDDPDNLKGY
jgi:hypothetical protein